MRALDGGEGLAEAVVLSLSDNGQQRRREQPARGGRTSHHQAGTASPGAAPGDTASPAPIGCSGPSSPSHLATTAVASELPITLVALRPMSRKVSMPMIISSPASGMPNWLKVEAITTNDARGTPATPFEVIINVASMANCCPSDMSIL